MTVLVPCIGMVVALRCPSSMLFSVLPWHSCFGPHRIWYVRETVDFLLHVGIAVLLIPRYIRYVTDGSCCGVCMCVRACVLHLSFHVLVSLLQFTVFIQFPVHHCPLVSSQGSDGHPPTGPPHHTDGHQHANLPVLYEYPELCGHALCVVAVACGEHVCCLCNQQRCHAGDGTVAVFTFHADCLCGRMLGAAGCSKYVGCAQAADCGAVCSTRLGCAGWAARGDVKASVVWLHISQSPCPKHQYTNTLAVCWCRYCLLSVPFAMYVVSTVFLFQ